MADKRGAPAPAGTPAPVRSSPLSGWLRPTVLQPSPSGKSLGGESSLMSPETPGPQYSPSSTATATVTAPSEEIKAALQEIRSAMDKLGAELPASLRQGLERVEARQASLEETLRSVQSDMRALTQAVDRAGQAAVAAANWKAGKT
eukprot:TRINITY_DN5459_c0_g1_i1.p2 TRINITY_DN5459_c0_g1~~TRINITY_DN5459_c0_g1_i1.p2  ORF type:complete len:146 (-),score=38.40 TRINITY_DN5459_c0_g1_i1:19-456(-)